jgi:hypothetical protein
LVTQSDHLVRWLRTWSNVGVACCDGSGTRQSRRGERFGKRRAPVPPTGRGQGNHAQRVQQVDLDT